MGRRARLIVPCIPVHIVHRGNNRATCFQDERDYLVYRALLLDGVRRSHCVVHAYCLMGNHVHVLATPPAANSLALFMHGTAQRYASYYNRKYQRTGTVWEGRFRSCLVDSSEYLLACYRYIELNPVRAGLVNGPAAYRWSSYSANAGLGADPLVSRHGDITALGGQQYAAFVEDGIQARELSAIREAVNGGYPLGGDAFKAAVAAKTGRPTAPRKPGPKKKENGEGNSAPVPDLFSAGGAS